MRRFLSTLLILAGMTTAASAATVQLGWTAASPTTGITGYRVYYGTSTGVYTANINCGLTTTCTVGSLAAGSTYYFVVRAYNATGNESTSSNEVNAVITLDPVVITLPEPLLMPLVHSR